MNSAGVCVGRKREESERDRDPDMDGETQGRSETEWWGAQGRVRAEESPWKEQMPALWKT